jgi:hypothetical protein
LPLPAAPLGGEGFLHQFHGLGHFLEIAGVEAEILIEPIFE